MKQLRYDEAGLQSKLEELTKELKKECFVGKAELDNKYYIYLTNKAFAKLSAMILYCKKEVGAYMVVEADTENENTCIITDVLVPPQEVTGVTIDSDPTAQMLWMSELTDYQINNMRGHVHSHVNMATRPSKVDMDFRAETTNALTEGFYVFLIMNKNCEINAAVVDIDNNLYYEDKDCIVCCPDALDIIDEIEDNVKDKITTKVSVTKRKAPKKPSITESIMSDVEDNIDEDGMNYYGSWDDYINRRVYG